MHSKKKRVCIAHVVECVFHWRMLMGVQLCDPLANLHPVFGCIVMCWLAWHCALVWAVACCVLLQCAMLSAMLCRAVECGFSLALVACCLLNFAAP